MMQNKNEIDISEIMSIIPHRYPLLLVDRVTDFVLNKSIVGIKNVTMNEQYFVGHFPQRPVMPGVLIIEAMAQLSAVLVAKSMDSNKNKEVYFMSIDDCKFRKIVTPGDSLIMHSEIIQQRNSVWKFKAKANVGGELVAEGVLTAMVKNKGK